MDTIDPGAGVAAQWIAPNIAEALAIEVKTVEDGLLAMLRGKNQPEF